MVGPHAASSGNPLCDQAEWTEAALTDTVAARWPRLIGFSWWNEMWENDNNSDHDTNMQLQDNPDLTAVFQRLVGEEPRVLGRIPEPGQSLATREPAYAQPAPTGAAPTPAPTSEASDDEEWEDGDGGICPASAGLVLVGLVLGRRWACGIPPQRWDSPRRP